MSDKVRKEVEDTMSFKCWELSGAVLDLKKEIWRAAPRWVPRWFRDRKLRQVDREVTLWLTRDPRIVWSFTDLASAPGVPEITLVEGSLSRLERLARYGFCWVCGQPRDVKAVAADLVVTLELYCPNCEEKKA